MSISAERRQRHRRPRPARRERHGRAHPERRVGAGGQREARLVGTGGGIGHRRQLAQPHRIAPSGLGPELGLSGGGADRADQRLRHRHDRLAVAGAGDPHDRLAELQHLSRLGVGLGHHAGDVGAQRGVGERVLRQLDAPLRLQQSRAKFLDVDGARVGGLVARPALPLQRRDAIEVDLRLLERDPRRRAGRLGRLELQAQVGLVERRHDVARRHPRPDLGRAGEELAADAETEIGLGPGTDRPGEPVGRRGAVQPGRRHHDHLRGGRDRCGLARSRHGCEPQPDLGRGRRRGSGRGDPRHCECDLAASAHR